MKIFDVGIEGRNICFDHGHGTIIISMSLQIKNKP